MLLPIGLETTLSRFPRFTFGLIVVCGIVFALQNLFPGPRPEEVARRYVEVLSYYTHHPGLRLPPEVDRLTDDQLKQRIEIFSGQARRVDGERGAQAMSEEQATLNRLSREFLEALNSRPVQRFGFREDGPPINLLIALFLHAGWLHLLGNLLLLYLVGVKLEDLWGGWVVLGLFLVGGAVASLTHAALVPNSPPLVGASGGIAVLMGAFLVRLYQVRVRMFAFFFFRSFSFTWPAFVVLPLWFLSEVLTTVTGTSGHVATWAHFGGFGFGVLAAFALRVSPLERKLLTPEQQRAETKGIRDLEEGQSLLALGSARRAIPKLRAYLTVQPKDPEGWESLAKALRMEKEDFAPAGFRAVVEWLEVGQTVRALHLIGQFGLKLGVREALRMHSYLEPQQAQNLLRQALMKAPDDPFAPKAALVLTQTYPGAESLETAQWVYEHTLDPEWQERLAKHLAQAGKLS